ncbi:MAG: Crp/Fnr family transcriptional regulator [Terriglobales bacterium]
MVSESDGLVVSSALREQLLLLAAVVSKPRGTILFRRGDACAGVFLLCNGKVRLLLEDPAAILRPRIVGAGCVIGLPAAVGGSAYSLTAEVVEQAELACVPQEALNNCLQQNIELCFEVMNILSQELSETRSAIKQSGGPRPHR